MDGKSTRTVPCAAAGPLVFAAAAAAEDGEARCAEFDPEVAWGLGAISASTAAAGATGVGAVSVAGAGTGVGAARSGVCGRRRLANGATCGAGGSGRAWGSTNTALMTWTGITTSPTRCPKPLCRAQSAATCNNKTLATMTKVRREGLKMLCKTLMVIAHAERSR